MTKPIVHDVETARKNVEAWLHKPEHDAKPGQDEQTGSDDPTAQDHDPPTPVTDPPEED